MKDSDSHDAWLKQDLFEQVIQNSPVATLVIDSKHIVRQWNRALELITGVKAKDMLGSPLQGKPFYMPPRPIMADLIVDGTLSERVGELYPGKCSPSKLLPGVWDAEDFFPHFADGGKWLAFTAVPLTNQRGDVVGAIETLWDVTAEKKADAARREGEHLLHEIIDCCPVPMIVIDADHRITHWNRASTTIIGTRHEDIVGTRDQWKPFYAFERPILADLVLDSSTEDGVSEFYSGKYDKSKLIPGAWEATDFFPHFRSGPRWLYFTAACVHGRDGQVVGAVETLQDITEQRNYQLGLEHQANHDALTGLANRSLLTDRTEQALALARRQNGMVALLFIDLDNFKVVNDSLGHSVGDALIVSLAKRISASVRQGDTVARIGGDEFVALLYAPESEAAVADVMRRLIADVARSVEIDREVLRVSCSIGAALFPRDGEDVSTLMMNADAAMYRAKQSGRNTFSFFTRSLNEKANQRLCLERDLRSALEHDEFVIHYQPQVSLGSGRIIGAEALLRWNHPRLGLLSPADFIPLAEETGLIVPIGNWVMTKACMDAHSWPLDPNRSPLQLSVNLSSRQFQTKPLLEAVERAIIEFGVANITLELELTESILMEDAEGALEIMARLKDLGVLLAMDDFGTGFSSLGYLHKFPFDVLKIDRSFVAGLGLGRGTESIVRAIVALADSLDLAVIAEGVETLEQCTLLAAEGCVLVQGYYYGRPMPDAEFQHVLTRRTLGEPISTWKA